jgi:uncharacterized phage-associated protein
MESKLKAAILTVLEEMGTPVHRTKLVKLIYLAENIFYEHFGRTITGLGYMWDDHGPNAMSNAIVKEAQKLVEQDFARMKIGTSMYGTENYLYSLGLKKTDMAKHLLDSIERQVLLDTVKRYRNYSITQIVAASKKTVPFKKAHQYQVLEMAQSSEYVSLVEALKKDAQFMAALAEGTKANAETEGVKLDEFRQKYGL